MDLALFDLDNTLLSGDSDFEWAQFLITKGVLDRELYEARNLEFYEDYKAGTLDIHAFLDFQLKPLSRHSRAELNLWRDEFVAKKVRKMIAPGAAQLIDKHKLNRDLCVIITATNRFVTAPIARELNIQHLIATEPEHVDGEFTGAVSGTPCFREGKIACLEAWLDQRNLTWYAFNQSWFYSDSLNDLPLLKKVSQPVAVDPDATLKNYAEQHNWPVISLR